MFVRNNTFFFDPIPNVEITNELKKINGISTRTFSTAILDSTKIIGIDKSVTKNYTHSDSCQITDRLIPHGWMNEFGIMKLMETVIKKAKNDKTDNAKKHIAELEHLITSTNTPVTSIFYLEELENIFRTLHRISPYESTKFFIVNSR